jgi:indole-3-glycerol phosphate synthase
MIENILSQILDRKRKATKQLRADPSSRDFRERALQVRENAEPHRLRQALESDLPRLKIIAEYKR